ncbi:MAG: FkbM family methyltransferase [Lachnospiraceae bacterium]|nr:FkbM family methyltransferase [Lachnospiraceae bacterium]
MEIENIIIEKERKDEQIIAEVKSNKKSVCIYGCGDIGLNVHEFLEKNDIPVDFFIVDDKYYSPGNCKGLPVKKLSSILKKRNSLNLFIGFADFNGALEKIKNINLNSQIFCISNPFTYLQAYDLGAKFFLSQKSKFENALSLFEDKLSKEIFIAYLNTRINKNYKYMLPFNGCKTYFNNEIFTLSNDEVYIDCGAYNGDSVKSFLKNVNNKYKKIYAIEPDKKNFKKIEKFVSDNRIENITLMNKGVWKESAKLGFSDDGEQEGSITEEYTDNFIEVVSLDNTISSEKPTFIKFSVQGSEEDALLGTQNIIKNCHPKLAITIFMKPDALIKIPQIIKSINPHYKLYLRCEEAFFAKVILYAKAGENN